MKSLLLFISIIICLKNSAQNKLYPCQILTRDKIKSECIKLKIDSVGTVISICFRESSMGVKLFNPIDSSAGHFGQTKLFVNDINRICGIKHFKERFSYEDRYNLNKSLIMLRIYLDYYSDWTLKNVCFKWHRSLDKKENEKYYRMILNEIKIARL